VILHQFQCNICEHRIPWHPASGADCLCLHRRGPSGLEGSVLVDDDYRGQAPHSEVHICRVCEGALSKFFKERDTNATQIR
jgi:hypothetical protein